MMASRILRGRTATLGLETRSRLLREAAVSEYCAMGESLTQRRRVEDEGFGVVNSC